MKQLDPISVNQQLAHKNTLLVDIRSPSTCAEGVPLGARLMTVDELHNQAEQLKTEFNQVFVLCYQGATSARVCEQLGDGFCSVQGGFAAWTAQQLATEIPSLTSHKVRYERPIKIYGEAAQLRLAKSHVLVVGAGGLGSPALLYLAGSGVGQVTVIDDDVVTLNNLHRQILYREQDLGASKVLCAQARLAELNSDISIHAVNERLTHDNAHHLMASVDLIIDGSDNVSTRYLINDVCLELRKPWLFAAVSGFDVQVAMFTHPGLCYRCLFPGIEEGDLGSCNEEGILGPIPGLAAMLQVNESIKYLTDSGSGLKNEMLTYDLLNHEFKMLKYPAVKNCKHRENHT